MEATSRAPEHHTFISEDTCASIARSVREAERYWIRRHPVAPSFTLGAACYLDVPTHGHDAYFRTAVRGNAILQRRFRPLYDELRARLEAVLGEPASYSARYALPGFHVFVGSPEVDLLEPKIHFDLQDLDLEWDDAGPRRDHDRISFTVPIELPASGGGLWVWDVEYQPLADKRNVDVVALAEHAAPKLVPYRVGELVVHSGDRLHQIAKTTTGHEGEARMTLQGHGRRVRGTWILYW